MKYNFDVIFVYFPYIKHFFGDYNCYNIAIEFNNEPFYQVKFLKLYYEAH